MPDPQHSESTATEHEEPELEASESVKPSGELGEALRRREAERRRKLEELAERIEKLEESGEANGHDDGHERSQLEATIERIEEARRAAAKASAERIAEIEERLKDLRGEDEEQLRKLISRHVADVVGDDAGEDLRARIDELEEKIASLPEHGPDVDMADVVAKAEARLAEAEDRTVGRISEVGEAIHSLRSRLAKLEEEGGAEEVDERIGALEERLSAESEVRERLEAGSRTVRELDERVAELERRVADRIQKLERTFEDLRAALLDD